MSSPDVDRAARALVVAYELWVRAEHGSAKDAESVDAARTLANSIRYRAAALGFHAELLERTYEAAFEAHRQDTNDLQRRFLLREAAFQLQSLFDDLVFNAISLFDYIGCLVGLLVEGGKGSHKIGWHKGIGKAKQARVEASVQSALKEVDRPFVTTLLRYRSEIIHFRSDEVDGHVSMSLFGPDDHKLHVTAPRWFTEVVRLKSGQEESFLPDAPIVATGIAVLARSLGGASSILAAIRRHVEERPTSTPCTSTDSLTARWSRAGVLRRLSADPRLSELGVIRVGAVYRGPWFSLLIVRGEDDTIESEPIDLRPLLDDELATQVVLEQLVNLALETLVPK